MVCIIMDGKCAVQRGGFKQLRGGNRQETDEEKEDSTSQNPFASLFGGAKKAKVYCCAVLQAQEPPFNFVVHHVNCNSHEHNSFIW